MKLDLIADIKSVFLPEYQSYSRTQAVTVIQLHVLCAYRKQLFLPVSIQRYTDAEYRTHFQNTDKTSNIDPAKQDITGQWTGLNFT